MLCKNAAHYMPNEMESARKIRERDFSIEILNWKALVGYASMQECSYLRWGMRLLTM